MRKIFIMTAGMISLALTACSDDHKQYQAPMQQAPMQQAPMQQAPVGQPVIINQAPAQQSSSTSDMLLGGVVGYMAGQALNGSRQSAPAQQPQIIERRTIIREVPAKVVPVQPAPVAVQKPLAVTQQAVAPKNVPAAVLPRATPTWSAPATSKYSSTSSYSSGRTTFSSGKR